MDARVIKEAVVVGGATVLIGLVVGYVVGRYFSPELPEVCMR